MDYIYDPTSGELYHYGVKGMKWGVRRYQNKDGSLTAAGKKRYSDDDSGKTNDETKERKGLTDKQKKYIKIGAAVAVTALAVYGGYKVHQLYTGAGQEIDPATGFRLINKEMSDADNLLAINPGRARRLSTRRNMEIIDGSSTNCMLCTNAYELRKRGYDVHAGLEKSGRGYMPDQLFSQIYTDYKGTTKIMPSSDKSVIHHRDMYDKLVDYAKNEGPGSRGNVMVWWTQGGGHSMIWENVDGNVVFKDGQTNQVYKDFANQILSRTTSRQPVEMLRTDNLTLNTKNMKNYVNSDTILKTYVDHGGEIALKTLNDPVNQMVAMGVLYGGAAIYNHKNTKMVATYKQQHPNTKLSDVEILEMLSKEGAK